MTILLVGANYRTVPVEIRERLIGYHVIPEAVEVVTIATCNRLELYVVADDADAPRVHDAMAAALGNHEGLYRKQDADAVEHLMRVSAGIESLVLGETQILGQVSEAFDQAQASGRSGAVLSRLFQSALHAGKRAHTETHISRHTLSVSHAAALMVKEQLGSLESARALVIGAGEMADLAAAALRSHGIGELHIANRTVERAETLAEKHHGQVLAWRQVLGALDQYDVVITATAAPHPLIYAEDFPSRPLCIVDISVPRNVDTSRGIPENVCLFDIDDLQNVVADHRAARQAEVKQVEAIVEAESTAFMHWLASRQVTPLITELRHKAQTMVENEVALALRRMPDLSEQERAIVQQMAHRIANKLLHAPTVALKTQPAPHYAHAVRQLFALDQASELDQVSDAV